MLAFYGTGMRERVLHESWRLRKEELLPFVKEGSVELVIEARGNTYKIDRYFGQKGSSVSLFLIEGQPKLLCKRDEDVKRILEEEVGITPGLANIIMSNEQSLIGALSYDERLQANVWEGWKWRTEIIRGNLKGARDKCAKEVRNLYEEIRNLKIESENIFKRWLEKGIFSKEELAKLNTQYVADKLKSFEKEISLLKEEIGHFESSNRKRWYRRGF